MVAIDHMTPHQVGLKDILRSYIEHRKQVITKRSQFDLAKAQKRQHIVEGLMKALSILDEVIATIRESKDKKTPKEFSRRLSIYRRTSRSNCHIAIIPFDEHGYHRASKGIRKLDCANHRVE